MVKKRITNMIYINSDFCLDNIFFYLFLDYNITEILLKLVLNTITLSLTLFKFYEAYYIFLIVQSFLHVLNILYNTLDWIGKFSCILQPGHDEPRLIALWGQSLFFLTIYFVYMYIY